MSIPPTRKTRLTGYTAFLTVTLFPARTFPDRILLPALTMYPVKNLALFAGLEVFAYSFAQILALLHAIFSGGSVHTRLYARSGS